MTYHDDYYEYAKADVKATHYLMQTNAGVFDTELMDRQMGWIDDQRKKAEFEAQKERVRQAMRSLNNVKTSEWVGNLMYVEACVKIDELKHACDMMGIYWKDEGDMKTKEQELKDLKAELAKVQKQIDKIEHGRLGKEPANGSVFKIERKFERYGTGYTYSAVRADGKWYLTGTRGDATKAMSWDELKRWIGDYSRVWVMTAKEELV
jgi:hypothetical protein